ncbi:CU044_5270 family protein [Kribbella sp. NPDC051952]|uniref:CU044_5270 family protein n=1 Tax=Kribbella sp. NPDC051952 TaxID=3154851 RepID=UPI003434AEA5
MNEFEKLRRAFPEQDGPTPEAIRAARQQIEGLIREARTPAVSKWRAGWVGTAVTAATAMVAVVGLGGALLVGNRGGSEAGPSVVTPMSPRLVTAAQVLLAAAVRQEVDEKVSGRYYRVRSLQVTTGPRVGRPRYTLERRSITESWMPMKPGVESWFGWVQLGYRPATPADVAMWKAQGSPRTWLPYPDQLISSSDGEPVVNKMSFRDVPPGYFLTGDKPLSAQQIAALPTDPAKLTKVLAQGTLPDATAEVRNYAIFSAAGRLLFETPSPPKLRGAALRVLATLPGTRIRTGVKDPIGRVGTEVTITADLSKASGGKTFLFGRGASFIIDAATGRLLSSHLGGPKNSSTIVLESGWTDDKPTPPSRAVR